MGKNLNFCPTPGKHNEKALIKDTNQFIRRIKLRAHFGNTKIKATMENLFKGRSMWEPNNIHHTINTFSEAMNNEIQKAVPPKKYSNNLTKKELESLEELRNRQDLIFTKADKGGALVIMNVKDYISEANRQLDDIQYYRKLNDNPTAEYSQMVNATIDRYKVEGIITEKMAKGLKSEEPKTSKFYMNPKIHKNGNPGRPVINSVDCHSMNISKFVDYHLQPEVQKLISFTKDSTDTINKLKVIKNEVKKNDVLVTMDVRALYTNIPNDEGIQAVREKLNASPSRLPSRIITTFLTLILTLNNFTFNGINYLQTKGCAMGTKCAPAYANIFMGNFEETHIYPRISDKIRIYLRYIDDLFFIWKETEFEQTKFFEEINKVHQSIKFDYCYSATEVNFLDLTIYKDKDGKVATKVFTKPTDRQSYLYKSSCHPAHLKKSIPFGQALRLRRICTESVEFDKACEKLKTRLLQRGYSNDNINAQISKAKKMDREYLLKRREKDQLEKLPFVVTYNQQLPNLREAIDKHWDILHIHPKFREIFKNKPMLAFRRNVNLGDIIGQKNLTEGKIIRKKRLQLKEGQCKPCHSRSDNLCCKQIQTTKKFTSTKTKEEFKIYHQVNCKSKFVIYLMECCKCKLQYVGKSEHPMNIRINKHRDDVSRPDAIKVCQHFNTNSHKFNRDAIFTIIEQLQRQNRSIAEMRHILEGREDFWIRRLNTLHPNGFNIGLNNA